MKKNELFKIGKDLGIDDNKIEKMILKITGLSKSQLFLCDEVSEKYIENIIIYLNRIVTGEPIEYIINNAEFYGLYFYVDNRVLIPRNDTEIMVDKAIEEIEKYDENITLIDVGTGSSCIAISVFQNTKNIENGIVTDISLDALDVSKINIKKYNLENTIEIVEGDLLEPIFNKISGYKLNKNIIITANLPYIKDGDFQNMDIETIFYEPDIALYGGMNTGFELYEKLINQITKLKNIYDLNNITLFIEIGFDQKEVSEKYLNKLGKIFEVYKDNFGIERCIKIEM